MGGGPGGCLVMDGPVTDHAHNGLESEYRDRRQDDERNPPNRASPESAEHQRTLFPNMLHADPVDFPDMLVGEPIVHDSAFLAIRNDLELPEQAQVMADR